MMALMAGPFGKGNSSFMWMLFTEIKLKNKQWNKSVLRNDF